MRVQLKIVAGGVALKSLIRFCLPFLLLPALPMLVRAQSSESSDSGYAKKKIPETELQAVLRAAGSLQDKAEKLVQMAVAAGGHDNITVVLVDFQV